MLSTFSNDCYRNWNCFGKSIKKTPTLLYNLKSMRVKTFGWKLGQYIQIHRYINAEIKYWHEAIM